jgi:hypothetical protein
MGRAAIDLLVTQIAGSGTTTDELLFEPELVVRGSTAPAPASAAVVVPAAASAGVPAAR